MRKAAGDAAATLYEASPECTEISNDSSGTSVGDVGSTEQLLTQSDPLKDVTKEQMLHEMKNLSVGSTTKWQTRKERVAYRKSFRQMLTTLEVS